MWKSIKELTINHVTESRVSVSSESAHYMSSLCDIWDVHCIILSVKSLFEPFNRYQVQSSAKGQLELILELAECESSPTISTPTTPGNPFEMEEDDMKSPKTPSSRTFSFKGVKNIMKLSKRPKNRPLCLRVVTSRMRCSIKAKEEFERSACKLSIRGQG